MNWIDNLKKIMKEGPQGPVNIERLKDLIEANGHKLSRNSISNILNGKNSPKIETLQIIAQALQVNVNDLFKDSSLDQGDQFICPNCRTKLKVTKN